MSARYQKPHIPYESRGAQTGPPEMCPTTGKRKYASEAEAQATARRQMSQKLSPSLQLRTYRCLYCNAWHLTSKET
jgi:hypothetical protein